MGDTARAGEDSGSAFAGAIAGNSATAMAAIIRTAAMLRVLIKCQAYDHNPELAGQYD